MNIRNKQSYINIKNNGLKHSIVQTRGFGAYNAGQIRISGRPLARTWSLLANKAVYGMTSISLLHKPEDMISLSSVILLLYPVFLAFICRVGKLVIELL